PCMDPPVPGLFDVCLVALSAKAMAVPKLKPRRNQEFANVRIPACVKFPDCGGLRDGDSV
ncbi:MAG TPA: hypothetical protein VIL32_16475, partial [Steroidobacteraceae bacterium]